MTSKGEIVGASTCSHLTEKIERIMSNLSLNACLIYN